MPLDALFRPAVLAFVFFGYDCPDSGPREPRSLLVKLVTFFLHCSPPALFRGVRAVGLFVTDAPVFPESQGAYLKTEGMKKLHSPLKVRDILLAAQAIIFPVSVLPSIW